jgi:hypothetical protein
LHGRAERLEAEAAECRRQAAVHTAECHKAGITFIDLADVHTVDGSAVAPRCSVDGSAGGRRFDVV